MTGAVIYSKCLKMNNGAKSKDYDSGYISLDVATSLSSLMGRQPTNLETGLTSAMWPSRERCETSIFPNLKRLISGFLFHDFSNHFNLLPWSQDRKNNLGSFRFCLPPVVSNKRGVTIWPTLLLTQRLKPHPFLWYSRNNHYLPVPFSSVFHQIRQHHQSLLFKNVIPLQSHLQQIVFRSVGWPWSLKLGSELIFLYVSIRFLLETHKPDVLLWKQV